MRFDSAMVKCAAGARRETAEEANANVDILAPYAHLDIPTIAQTYILFRSAAPAPPSHMPLFRIIRMMAALLHSYGLPLPPPESLPSSFCLAADQYAVVSILISIFAWLLRQDIAPPQSAHRS